jgi:hypothetical protein
VIEPLGVADLTSELKLMSAPAASALRQRRNDVLPVDPVGTARGLARHDHIAVRVQGIAAVEPHAAGQHAVENAKGGKYARHVVVDGDPVAFAKQ